MTRRKRSRATGWPRTNYRNLRGSRFGRLTVVRETNRRTTGGQVIWLCRCDCGQEREVVSTNLTTGNTQSCGYLQREVSRKPNHQRSGG